MSKKFLALFTVLVLCLALTACGGASGESGATPEAATNGNEAPAETGGDAAAESGDASAANTEEPYTITMAYIAGGDQPNQAAVHQAVNDLLLEEMNMNIEFVQLGFGDYQSRLNLMLSGGDRLDILPIYFTAANTYINAGQIVNLADYIDDYGQDILSYMGEDVAKSGAVNGFIYGTPANKESASRAGIVMRKDIVDELGIDVDAIKTYADITPILAQVKEAYPTLDAITGINLVSQIQDWDPLNDSFGVLMDDGQDTTVVNFFETDSYKQRVQLITEWYKNGYVKLDAATTTETAANLVKAGTLFSYLAPIKPGYLIQENVAAGQEMTYAYIGKDDGSVSNIICTLNVNFFNWGIAQQSQDKVKAMQFLNFAYSSPEWNNLMNFGIEGQDYVRVEGSDTFIDYPAGKDATTAYHLNMGWMLPNQFIGHVWNGQPEDVWQQYRDFNASAVYSKAFGFIYDPSSVANELTALFSVDAEYRKPLETGSSPDWEATLTDFNARLYEAGLQKVMDLKQEQLNAWLDAK